MNLTKLFVAVLLGALMPILFLTGCGKTESPAPAPKQELDSVAPEKPLVVVTNYPLHFMAQQLAGEHLDIQFPVPAEKDPGYWKPSDADIALMQRADLLVINGAEHEPWLDKVTLDDAKLLDSSKAFADQYITIPDAVVHSHGDEGVHSHAGTIFTLWLDPTLARLQAKAMLSAFLKLSPDNADKMSANYEKLEESFAELDGILDAFSLNYKQEPLIASHPVYQYLERRCKLNLKSMHWEPGETPDAAGWVEFDKLLETHPAKWMLWEGEPSPETRAALGERGVNILLFPLLGNTPESGGYFENMLKNYEALLGINVPAVK